MAAICPVNIISPHRDDAAFSLALLLERLLSASCAVRVVNCYTVSAYAPLLATADARVVSTIRAAEDELFFASLPGQPLVADLGRRDAPLRLERSADGVCHPLPFTQGDREEMDAIGPEIERAAAQGPWLLPLAIGNHIDHRLVLSGGLLTAGSRALGFYEDLPYAGRLPEESVVSAARQVESLLGNTLRSLVVGTGDGALRKRALIGAYRSQLADAGMNEIEAYTRRRGGERLWLEDELHRELAGYLRLAQSDCGVQTGGA